LARAPSHAPVASTGVAASAASTSEVSRKPMRQYPAIFSTSAIA
jgi:hypothetical protein